MPNGVDYFGALMPDSKNKTAVRWLVYSILFSTVLFGYSLGQAVGSNRFGDNATANLLMTVVVPLFFASVFTSAWSLHSVIDGFTEAEYGARTRVAKWIVHLPPGFRIIAEIGVALAAPIALPITPMLLTYPWWPQ